MNSQERRILFALAVRLGQKLRSTHGENSENSILGEFWEWTVFQLLASHQSVLAYHLASSRQNIQCCSKTTMVSYSTMRRTSLADGVSISRIGVIQSLSHHPTDWTYFSGGDTIIAADISLWLSKRWRLLVAMKSEETHFPRYRFSFIILIAKIYFAARPMSTIANFEQLH